MKFNLAFHESTEIRTADGHKFDMSLLLNVS